MDGTVFPGRRFGGFGGVGDDLEGGVEVFGVLALVLGAFFFFFVGWWIIGEIWVVDWGS